MVFLATPQTNYEDRGDETTYDENDASERFKQQDQQMINISGCEFDEFKTFMVN